MPRVRVNSFAVSLDGYAAGPNQSLENPLGVRGPELFEWVFPTRTWKQMHGYEGGSTGVDNEWAQRGMENVGAWILGRNMFGPVRGPLAGRLMERMVGRGTAVSRAYVRADTSSTRLGGDERRHNLSFRYGRHPCRLATSEGSCEGQGCAHRRRCRHHPAIHSRKARRTKCTSHFVSVLSAGRVMTGISAKGREGSPESS
jgi:hypothetical protein